MPVKNGLPPFIWQLPMANLFGSEETGAKHNTLGVVETISNPQSQPDGASVVQAGAVRKGPLPGLFALLANQPPGEIVHACRGHVAQRA
jgi:hypothetical protein